MTLEHRYADIVFTIALIGIFTIAAITVAEALAHPEDFAEKVRGIFNGTIKEDHTQARIGVYIFAIAPLFGLLYVISWSISRRETIMLVKAVIILIIIVLALTGFVKVHI